MYVCTVVMGYEGSSGISVATARHFGGRERGNRRQTDLQQASAPLDLGLEAMQRKTTHTVQTTMMFCDVMARVANLIVL